MKSFVLMGVLSLFFCSSPIDLYSFCFEEAGTRYNINPKLLKSIARVESGFNARAVNKNPNGSTDMGLMQINSAWLKTINATRDDLMNDACLNTMTGAWILRQCVDRHGYTWEAVGCYNAYSREKRVNYAWKVFHALKGVSRPSNLSAAQAGTAGRETKKASYSKETGKSSSSFVFRVRDVADEDNASR